ncbi:MAG: PQQ-binding-like beta-propeller repeat protein [Vicinamibacteria bacterium]
MFEALVLAALLAADGAGPDRGEALRDAARTGDVASVTRLLAEGVPVDAKAPRHGQTPLLFAAGEGRLEVVRLLVARGADVNARETFFGQTPLSASLGGPGGKGHREVALFLLSKGAADAADALGAAVDAGDVELARAALATGRVEPLELAAARVEAGAAEKKDADLQALLASAKAEPRKRQAFAIAADELKKYAGRFRAGAGPATTVAVRGEGLVITTESTPELVVAPIAERRFESAAGDTEVRFYGRAGTIEGLSVNRAGQVTRLGVATADLAPLKQAAAPSLATTAPRAAARPWPQFRGPQASGVGDGQGVPATWDVAKGTNVRFKTPLPGLSLSSPIVWGGRIFVTSAISAKGETPIKTGLYGDGTSVDDLSAHSFRLYALDAKTGATLWDREVVKTPPTVRRHMKSSLANATPATDGKNLVVLFGTVGVLAAFDWDGKERWRKDVGVLDTNDPQAGVAEWGHASSPILYDDLVIVQGDRRKDSFLAAYRLADGSEAWRVARDEPSTWSTPNVLLAPSGDELVTNGQTIRAYDPKTGRVLWTLKPNSEVVVASPIVADGMAFVTAGYPPVRPVYAVRAGQRGDLTLPDGQTASAAIAWSHPRGGTYIPTPLLYRGHLYTVNNNGILTCYRADTGAQVYQTRLGAVGASFAASPVAADGRLFFASETGEVYVLRAGPEFELLATNVMDEVVMATPALSDGLMVVRTTGHVVGLAAPEKTTDR